MEEFQKVFQSEAFGVKAHQQLIKQKKKKSTLLQVNISFLHKHQ